jgi:hypothetical protein
MIMKRKSFRGSFGRISGVVLLCCLVTAFTIISLFESKKTTKGFAASVKEKAIEFQASLSAPPPVEVEGRESHDDAVKKKSPSPASSPMNGSLKMNMKGSDIDTNIHPIDDSLPAPPKRLCGRDEIRKGFWTKHVYQDGLAYDPKQVHQLNDIAYCQRHLDVDTNGAWHTWRWVPSNSTDAPTVGNLGCEMTRWNKNEFCSLIRDHYTTSASAKTNITTTATNGNGAIPTILITGDSLSSEQYISVIGLLGMPKGDYPASNKAMRRGIQDLACNGTFRLAHNRRNRLEKLGEVLNARKPTIVVFNRGAHYANDTILEQDMRRNIADLNKWQKGWCVATGTPCRLFYRTTAPGHRNCSQFTEPVNDAVHMEEYVAQSDIYNWNKFQHQNELMQNWFDEAGLDYQVIDAYDLMLLRPDNHLNPDTGDCSHNCVPGKPDVYNELILHYLKLSFANGEKNR